MGSRAFGIKSFGVVGSGNTSVLGSSADLKLQATGQVAITTNTSVSGVVTATSFVGNGGNITGISTNNIVDYGVGLGGISDVVSDTTPQLGGDLDLNNKNITGTGNVNITGVVTATSFSGDGSNLTGISFAETDTLATVTLRGNTTTDEITAANFRSNNTTGDGSDVGFAIKYYVTANGFSAYRFAGPGLLDSTDNPTFYLQRGFTYIFENSTGTGHPFRIQFVGTTIGVGTYVSGSQTGTQVFTIPFDAPSSYEYQCTLHSGMLGTFNVA